MADDLDELRNLADSAELLEQEIRNRAGGNAILIHAANTTALVGPGIRKAIAKLEAAAERRAAHVERVEADQVERQYDELTKTLAQQRGISYEAMQQIRDEAAVRSRAAAGRGSISEQTARAPKV